MTVTEHVTWNPLRDPHDWPTAHRVYLDCVDAARAGGRGAGVAAGLAGFAVLDHVVARTPLGAAPVGANTAELWQAVASMREFDVSLFSGHTGVLWALAWTTPLAVPAVVAAADRMSAGLPTAAMHFDLVLGAAGLLVLGRLVARQAGDDQLSAAVLARLRAMTDDSSAWPTPTGRYRRETPAVAGEYYYDWGVAHGQPGAVVTAARAELELGRASAATGWLTEFERSADRVGLTARIDADRHPLLPIFSGPGGSQFSRAESWCYGDAGAATALALAALAAGHRAAPYVAAARTALRRGATHLTSMEPGLCHGAAGLALLAARMYHATADHRFAELAVDIVDHAIAAKAFDASTIAADYGTGLLRGTTGVALALHALLSADPPDWDMILGLS